MTLEWCCLVFECLPVSSTVFYVFYCQPVEIVPSPRCANFFATGRVPPSPTIHPLLAQLKSIPAPVVSFELFSSLAIIVFLMLLELSTHPLTLMQIF